MEAVIFTEVKIKISIIVIFRKDGSWNTLCKRKKLGDKSKYILLKALFLAKTHSNITKIKPFTLFPSMWCIKQSRHFQITEGGERSYSVRQISYCVRQLNKMQLKLEARSSQYLVHSLSSLSDYYLGSILRIKRSFSLNDYADLKWQYSSITLTNGWFSSAVFLRSVKKRNVILEWLLELWDTVLQLPRKNNF